jgi:AcrR family transcriptional regulator
LTVTRSYIAFNLVGVKIILTTSRSTHHEAEAGAMKRPQKKKDSYHHGDLRQALLAAGLALLEQDGIEGLTLRRTAAAAGVSHAAPAHHFPTLKTLLTALAAIAFERFGAAIKIERDKAGADPEVQMRAACQGYVNFAAENPALFRLMFSNPLIDWRDNALRDASHAAFHQLEEIVEPMTHMAREFGGRVELLKLVWCVVHGYAHLYLEGPMQRIEGPSQKGTQSTPRPPDIARLITGKDKSPRHQRTS